MKAIFKREFRAFFQTVIGWLFLAVTLGLFGLYFYVYNLSYGSPYLADTLSAITFILLLTVPLLTMRILAEDKKSKTDQLILTSPVSVGKVVVGKFFAMGAVFSIAVGIMCVTPLFLRQFGAIPYGECYVAILGYWLFGLTCIAIGTFISALTESQVIAAVLTFGVLFLGYMMSGITNLISASGNVLTAVLNSYNLAKGMDNFLSGFFDLEALLYYVSLIFLFLFFAVQAIQKRRWSMSTRKIKTGVFSTGFLALGIGVAIVINLIGAQIPEAIRTFDVTSQKLYSITEDTKKTLAALDEDVTIYVLANEKNQDDTLRRTLERYRAASSHISIVYKDPAVSPSFYTEYTTGSVTKNSLIVEGSKRSKVIDFNTVYAYETDYTTYQSTVTGYDAEGQLTSAIAYVTSENTPVVYQLTGHGEQTLDKTFTDAVAKLNVTLESLNLLEQETVPEDASGLIINAPGKDFSDDDVNKLLDYLAGGGKAVIVSNYTEEKMPNFEKLLAAYQVTLTNGIILESDTSAYYQLPYYLMPKAASDEATAEAAGNYVFVPYAQGLTYPKSESTEETDETEKNEITYTELLATTDTAYAKMDVAGMESYEKEKGDIDGPFTLGLRVAKTVEEEKTELYLFTSGSLFTEKASQMVYGNNATLFTGIISQFTGSQADSMIPVKNYLMEQLVINQSGIVFSGLLAAVLVPLFLVAVGIIIWARRRRK